jgi:hypothetical protein
VDQHYRAYLASEDWKQKAKEARAYYHNKCAVCDLDYQQKGVAIHVHHLFYRKFRKSIIGKEHPYHHLRLLCALHHPKGKLSNESIQLWRKSYRFCRRWKRIFAWLRKRK